MLTMMVMMMTSAGPWVELSIPNQGYNVRLVKEGLAIPMYWGKDMAGHLLFIIELAGEHSELFKKEKVSVRGVDVDFIMAVTAAPQRLVLTLDSKVDVDLFEALCQTIIGGVEKVIDPNTALSVALSLLKRWKQFLAGKRRRLLSAEEVRGLFAELWFLRILYSKTTRHLDAIEAWQGPERSHQDFIFGDTAFEIKSLSGRERSAVRISSEDQLESTCDNLYLVIIKLFDVDKDVAGISLNELVKQIFEEITDADACNNLEIKLANYGYARIDEYSNPFFKVSGVNHFVVNEGFPRLIRSSLQDGIARLSYDIEIEKINQFETTPEIFKEP